VTTFYETIKVINSGIVLEKGRESILDWGIRVMGTRQAGKAPGH